DLVRLADVAHVGGVPERRGPRAGAESLEPLAELRAERVVLLAQRDGFTERRLDARVHRPDRVVDDVGAERAERAERARRARDEDRRDPDLAGDERADHGPGAAEGDQREISRIDGGTRENLGELRVP